MPASARRRRTTAAAVLLLAVTPLLASCGMEFTTTESQPASGNGRFGQVGDVSISNLTIVLGPAGSKSATLIGNLTNVGVEPDALTGVELLAPPAKGALTTDPVPLLPRAFDPVSVGWESDVYADFNGVDLPVSHFLPVRLTFRRAGSITFDTLVVLPVGVYEGIAPKPAASRLPVTP